MADSITDRMVAITDQTRYVDPYQQRVFQYDTEQSDVFLARVVNSLLRIFGDNVVINGFSYKNIQIINTDNDILIKVDPGMLIQDLTLIEFSKSTSVMLENLSGLSVDGRVVVYVKYQFLHSIEQNLAYICVNYISKNGTPRYDWNHDTDRTVVGILSFKKDEDDNVISCTTTDEKYIDIDGKRYYLFGIDPTSKELTTYLLRMVYKEANTSIQFDDGLSFIGDINDPGANKYYGTDDNDSKGWYPFPGVIPEGTSFLQLNDTPDTYSGSGGYLVRVNCAMNGLVFDDVEIPDVSQFVLLDKDQVITSNKILDGDLWVLGNCNIRGTVTYIDHSEISITNNEILLNVGETGNGVSSIYSGLRVKRGTSPDALLRFNENTDTWQVGFEGIYPYSDLALNDEKNDITDEGLITQYAGTKYRMHLVNGNLSFREIGTETTDDILYYNPCK